MRTRILPKMLNTEVEQYLERNDVIIVPVGTVELHGGFPLDSETVISEAFALKMAEAADGLVLTGLPYFYAGATAMARGTTQVLSLIHISKHRVGGAVDLCLYLDVPAGGGLGVREAGAYEDGLSGGQAG